MPPGTWLLQAGLAGGFFIGILTAFLVWSFQGMVEAREEAALGMPGGVTVLYTFEGPWVIAAAAFFDMDRGVGPLDRRLVIRAPARMLPLLGPLARQEALRRAVLFAPADEVVDAYASSH